MDHCVLPSALLFCMNIDNVLTWWLCWRASTYVLDVAEVDGVHHPAFVVFDVSDGESVEGVHFQVPGARRYYEASVIHQVGVECGLEAGVHK